MQLKQVLVGAECTLTRADILMALGAAGENVRSIPKGIDTIRGCSMHS